MCMNNRWYQLLVVVMGIVGSAGVHGGQCGVANESNDYDETGRSFQAQQKQLFQSQSPEMNAGFRDDRLHAREDGRGIAFQLVLLGSKSDDNERMRRYFTPFGLTQLIVDERILNPITSGLTQNVLSSHFNVFTENGNFRSIIEFHPQQTVYGLGMHFRSDIWKDEENNRAIFFSASSPWLHVSNRFSIVENVVNDGGGVDTAIPGAVPNMIAAYRQPAWNYGKISDQCMNETDACVVNSLTQTGLADIELKLGIEWLERHPCHFESYLGVKIPTGNRAKGVYIFEPIVGNGGYVSVMFGTSGGARIWEKEECGYDLRLEYAIHSEYLFSRQQVRSLDLKNKPYSRYIQLYANEQQAQLAASLQSQNLFTPGINLLTLPVKVTPGYLFDMNSAFVFTTHKGFQAEAGYNLYYRKSDNVKLACPFVPGPAIKHEAGAGYTNPIRDITGNFRLEDDQAGGPSLPDVSLPYYRSNMLQESDLDLASCAQPAIMTHTLYVSGGYRWDDREYPIFMNIGGSGEFSQANNAALERWVLWGKFGLSF